MSILAAPAAGRRKAVSHCLFRTTMKAPRLVATRLLRFHSFGLSLAILLTLFGLAISYEEHGGELQELQHDSKVTRVEKALKSLEAKLNEVGPSPEHIAWQSQHGGGAAPALSDVSDGDVVMHAAPESTALEKPLQPPPATDRQPGQEWTASDQAAYDAEMSRALGFSGPTPKEDHMPAMFLPLASLPLQRDYAHNLVKVLQHMKEGYLEELVQWAVSGHKGENPFITPIVETLEAPLIKDLDKEAHIKVESTVADVAKRKDLSAAQMKSMRARLLVPLLLRIRARVHQQVQTYVVSMLRRIILYGSQWKGKSTFNQDGILAPAAGSAHLATDDEHMEYTLRDIDALYEKGILSKRDYQAEKAKLLSDWLGLAIKHIGGKKKARKALEEFLWPPTWTAKGCRCMLPFQLNVEQLGNKTVTYDECTDISNPQMLNATGSEQVPGPGWCAVDPDDGNCGIKSQDPRAFIGEGGYGWTNWDVCKSQPPTRDGDVPVDTSVKVLTEHGCTCRLPFEIYPLNLGGRIKRTLTTCTKAGGQDADWCATVGSCGRSGVPKGLAAPSNLSWTNWDRCIGEPAGYLASPVRKVHTRQGCVCRESWDYRPDFFKKTITYAGCTDVDSPGTAWCAVDGDSCGEVKADAASSGYSWTKWVRRCDLPTRLPVTHPFSNSAAIRHFSGGHFNIDIDEVGWEQDVCEDAEQPDEVAKELAANILPTPAPVVRTQDGCTCQLPYSVAADETSNQVSELQHSYFSVEVIGICMCSRVKVVTCGAADMTNLWCVGEPAGFLPPIKPLVRTKQGCICKLPFKFRLIGESMDSIFTSPTDLDSPFEPWCAIDAELSPSCGFKSLDVRAGFGPDKYGWDHWDQLPNKVKPLAAGALPPADVKVKTVNGCTCKLPYKISPPGVGQTLSFSTCNRYEQDSVGVTPYWWCLVEEPGCGDKGPLGQWDKCIGVPAGYLEGEPLTTQGGCECQVPFTYVPEAFSSKDCDPTCKAKTMIYTGCTDIDQRGGHGAAAPAWCATKGECGQVDKSTGSVGMGWSHWDKCTVQPPAKPAAVAPLVRTQNGCRCVFPFKYSPMDTCSFAQEDAQVCEAKGGDMVSGWCVVCKVESFSTCSYLDQADNTAWCAVDGACGIQSKDENALKTAAEGGYGWTHWDRCIGEAPGYIGVDQPYKVLFPPGGAANGSLHQLSAGHAVAQAALHASHRGEPLAAAVAAVAAAKARGRGPAGRRGRVSSSSGEASGDSDKIDALEKEMAHTLHTLNSKLNKLDEAPPAAAKSGAGRLEWLSAAAVVWLAATAALLPTH